MAFLDKTGLQNLTNKLVQGDAIKVASHRGKNVKEVIDNIQRECENVALPNTMTLENRVNEFKVGKGRDVDVSGDVEEGKVEVELKGKTYQNCFIEKAPWFSTETTLETSSTVAVGLSIRNQNHYDIKLIKSNTTYTIIPIVDFKDNYLADFYVQLNLGYEPVKSMFRIYSYDFNKPTVITTKTIVNPNAHSLFIGGSSKGDGVGSVKISSLKLLILEGDYSQTLIEELPLHFEGIQSSFEDGIVDVEVQGKNLFDYKKFIPYNQYQTCEFINDGVVVSGNWYLKNGEVEVESNSNYTLTFKAEKIGDLKTSDIVKVWGVNPNGTNVELAYRNGTGEIKFSTREFTKIQITPYSAFTDGIASQGAKVIYSNFYLEKTKTKTSSYEPYYKKKISFNTGEPLRSLPNGVCDEIRNNNGQWELVRRVGKSVLTGDENWTHYTGAPSSDTNKLFSCDLGFRANNGRNLYCNHFICTSAWSDASSEGIQIGRTNLSGYDIRINKSRLSTDTVTGFKQWLSENPTTVYYELAKPIITPIEPIEFNISQGAVINISSDISPTSTHKVILNRAGQIEQGIQLIADLKSRINNLERLYDSNLIATQYKLDNLKLNYELEREED